MSTTIAEKRMTIHCDKCPVRLDLGPAQAALNRNRMPSGWLALGDDRHLCPQCSATMAPGLIARRAA
jgi:hypothetical protein